MKNLNLILIVMVLFASSCSNKNISKATPEKDKNNQTQEVRNISSIWILEKINGSKLESKSTFLDIKMNDLSFSGMSFCNNVFGKVNLEKDSKIKFTNMGMTMMACEQELMQKETEYNNLLASVSNYKIKNDNLFLYDYNGKLVLEYVYSETKVITEQEGEGAIVTDFTRLYDIWGLKTLNNKTVDAQRGVILELNTKEMTFNGFASCNNLFGTLVSHSDTELSFVNIGATRKLCQDMKLENEYMTALHKVKSFKLKGLRLLFLDENDQVILDFVKID